MRRYILAAACCGGLAFMTFGRLAAAPSHTMIGTLGNNVSNNFFDNNTVGFGFSIAGGSNAGRRSAVTGFNFQHGGAGAAVPPFGGFQANDASTFGFGVNSGRGGFNLGISASQGSSGILVAQAISVTVMDGETGSASFGSLRPFVTSIVPVVGGFGAGAPFGLPIVAPPVGPFGTSVLAERLSRLGQRPVVSIRSTAAAEDGMKQPPAEPRDQMKRQLAAAAQDPAGQPAISIVAIRAQQAAEDRAAENDLRTILAQAKEAQSLGKPNVARIYYQQLSRRAQGELKQHALDALKELESQPQRKPATR
jgi:hypothetical protein